MLFVITEPATDASQQIIVYSVPDGIGGVPFVICFCGHMVNYEFLVSFPLHSDKYGMCHLYLAKNKKKRRWMLYPVELHVKVLVLQEQEPQAMKEMICLAI